MRVQRYNYFGKKMYLCRLKKDRILMDNNQLLNSFKLRFGIVGNSPLLENALERAVTLAPLDIAVLITGENGVGKENLARILHEGSARKHRPFVPINCGAIPAGTINSELFGHEKGSFSGADASHQGYFEQAEGGTIFLDEIADLPLDTQTMLLRILQTGDYRRVGAAKPSQTNVRVVAATNANLAERVESGRFREDLFYRINGIQIHLPALRERKKDIMLLFTKFATDMADKYRMPQITLTEDAREYLENYYWPGNIRQLKNMVESMTAIEVDRTITRERVQSYLADAPAPRHLPMLRTRGIEHDQQYNHDALVQEITALRKDVDDLTHIVHSLILQQYSPNAGQSSYPQEGIIRNQPYLLGMSPKTEDVEAEEAEAEEIGKSEVSTEEQTDNPSPRSIKDANRVQIEETLRKHHGNRRATAEELGISERSLYRKIKEYGI